MEAETQDLQVSKKLTVRSAFIRWIITFGVVLCLLRLLHLLR